MSNNCFVCNQILINIGSIGEKTILKCKNCGLGVTKNGFSQKDKYHRDETYIGEEALFKNIFKKRVNIICKFKSNGKVLEIGCSTGILLSLLKDKGWKVLGVEISKDSAKVANGRGIDVIVRPFQNLDFKENFGLVIFNHTLEHLNNPKEIIENVGTLLDRNGMLYIDLPNFGSLSASILGINWPLLLPNEHLWHFTREALSKLLIDSGFKIIYVEKASGIWDYADPWGGILYSFTHFKKRFFVESLTAIPSWIVWKCGLGSDLMVIAKKI